MLPGILFALLAMALWGTEEFFLKKAVTGLKSYTTLLVNTLVGLLLQFPVVLLFFGKEVRLISGPDFLFAALVSFIAFLGYVFFYLALERQDLSLISSLDNSWIVVSILIAILFFGERLEVLHSLAVAAVLLGGFLISADFSTFRRIRFIAGSGHVALSILFVGIVVPLDKMLIGRIGEANAILYTAFLVLLFILLWRLLGRARFVRPTAGLWRVSIASGIVDGLAFIFYILAVGAMSVSVVAPILASSVIVSMWLACIFLKERMTPKEILGAALILGAVLFLSARFGL